MSTSNLIRWDGLATFLGGVLWGMQKIGWQLFIGGQAPRTYPQPAATIFPDLTEREREVLTLISQGLSNLQIASQLHISSKTVGNHISNIFNKLQVVDRAQAIVKARQATPAHTYPHIQPISGTAFWWWYYPQTR